MPPWSIKGREHDQAKHRCWPSGIRVAGAHKEAARIRSQAGRKRTQLLKYTNLKAEAIRPAGPGAGHLPGPQDGGRPLPRRPNSPPPKFKRHRLRLARSASRIDAMSSSAPTDDFLAKMIAEQQETQDYAQQNTPQPQENKERPSLAAEPQLDLSPPGGGSAASALLPPRIPTDAQPAPAPEELTDDDASPATACGSVNGMTTQRYPASPPVPDGPKNNRSRIFRYHPPLTSCSPADPAGRSRRQAEGRGRNSGRHFLLPPSFARKGSRFWTRNRRAVGPTPRCCRTCVLPTRTRRTTTPSPPPQPRRQPAPTPAAPAAGSPAKVTATRGPRRK